MNYAQHLAQVAKLQRELNAIGGYTGYLEVMISAAKNGEDCRRFEFNSADTARAFACAFRNAGFIVSATASRNTVIVLLPEVEQ